MTQRTTRTMNLITGDYELPRHNVLLISCMDLRLIDELAAFMDTDNLTNRYDHLVLAGTSIGVFKTKPEEWSECWKTTLKSHVKISVDLHEPHDIYLVEHRNCGAYKAFLDKFDDTDPEHEKHEHTRWAAKLKVLLEEWWKEFDPRDKKGEPIPLHVHGFLMDLRGDVEVLDLDNPPAAAGQTKTTAAKKPRKKAT